MSSIFILEDINMNIFTDITKQTTDPVKKDLFSKIQYDTIDLYKGYLQDYSWVKRISDTEKTLRSHRFIEK